MRNSLDNLEINQSLMEMDATRARALAELYFQGLLELGFPITYETAKGLSINVDPTGKRVDGPLILRQMTGKEAGSSLYYNPKTEQKFIGNPTDGRTLEQILTFINSIPELAASLCKRQAERQNRALEAINNYLNLGQEAEKLGLKDRLKQLAIKGKVENIQTSGKATLEEVKVRKDQADFYAAEVEHLAIGIVSELVDSKTPVDYKGNFDKETKNRLDEQRAEVEKEVGVHNAKVDSLEINESHWHYEERPEFDFSITKDRNNLKVNWYAGLNYVIGAYNPSWTNDWHQIELFTGDDHGTYKKERGTIIKSKYSEAHGNQEDAEFAKVLLVSKISEIAKQLNLREEQIQTMIASTFDNRP